MGLSREAVMPPAALPAAFFGFPLGWKVKYDDHRKEIIKDTGLLRPQMLGAKLGIEAR